MSTRSLHPSEREPECWAASQGSERGCGPRLTGRQCGNARTRGASVPAMRGWGAGAPTRLRIAAFDVLTILSQDWAQMSNRQSKATPLPARNVKETIRALAAARGSIQSGLVARELDITRQAVNYHL